MAKKKVSKDKELIKEEVKEQPKVEETPEVPEETAEDKSEETSVEDLLKGTPYKSLEDLRKGWENTSKEGQLMAQSWKTVREKIAEDPELKSKLGQEFGLTVEQEPINETNEIEESSVQQDPWVEEQKQKEEAQKQADVDSFVNKYSSEYLTSDGAINPESWRRITSKYPLVIEDARQNGEFLSTSEALERARKIDKTLREKEEDMTADRQADNAVQSTGATGKTVKPAIQLTPEQKDICKRLGMSEADYIEGINLQDK